MLINQLSFAEFYDSFRHRQRYKVLITLVARAADAKPQYRDIIENWSSFHDLTGGHVAFVFAGALVKEPQPLGWYKNGKMDQIPDGIYVPQPAELELQSIPDEMFVQVSPDAPEPMKFYSNQTLRTREIKAALGIPEKQIPCLHFLFLRTNTSEIVPLSDIEEDIYRFFKSLFNKWDNVFQNFESELATGRTRLQQQSTIIGRHNTSVGNAKKLFDELERATAYSTEGVLKIALQPLLQTIKNIGQDPELKKQAFEQLTSIKRDHPTVSARLLTDLNRMIDWAHFIHEQPISQSIETSDLYDKLDITLRQMLTEIAPPQTIKIANMENTSHTTNPLKAFISYSKFDGESNTSGTNLLQQFKNMIAPLSTYQRLIETWDDTKLIAGEEWDNQIKSELETSDIIFLLISNNFLATRYIREVELEAAIRRHDAGECRVVPIILSACGWMEIPMLSKLNGIPRKGHTITSWKANDKWHSMDDAWHHVFNEVKALIVDFNNKRK